MSGRVAAVVLAGGAGSRFGAGVSKVYVPLGGRPILTYALDVLHRSEDVDDVVLVIRAGDEADHAAASTLAPGDKVRAVVAGGATRQGSEQAGLDALAESDDTDLVLLHDAARPFLTVDLIARLVDAARRTGGGAVPGVPLAGDLVDARGTPIDVADLIAVQTPQVFPLGVLRRAFRAAAVEGVEGVDTSQTVQAVDAVQVAWVDSGPRNLKITHPEDLALAEELLPSWDRGHWTG